MRFFVILFFVISIYGAEEAKPRYKAGYCFKMSSTMYRKIKYLKKSKYFFVICSKIKDRAQFKCSNKIQNQTFLDFETHISRYGSHAGCPRIKK